MVDPEISGGGRIITRLGVWEACKPPVGSRSEASGYQTKYTFTFNVFNNH